MKADFKISKELICNMRSEVLGLTAAKRKGGVHPVGIRSQMQELVRRSRQLVDNDPTAKFMLLSRDYRPVSQTL